MRKSYTYSSISIGRGNLRRNPQKSTETPKQIPQAKTPINTQKYRFLLGRFLSKNTPSRNPLRYIRIKSNHFGKGIARASRILFTKTSLGIAPANLVTSAPSRNTRYAGIPLTLYSPGICLFSSISNLPMMKVSRCSNATDSTIGFICLQNGHQSASNSSTNR